MSIIRNAEQQWGPDDHRDVSDTPAPSSAEATPASHPDDWKYALSLALPEGFPDDLHIKILEAVEPYVSSHIVTPSRDPNEAALTAAREIVYDCDNHVVKAVAAVIEKHFTPLLEEALDTGLEEAAKVADVCTCNSGPGFRPVHARHHAVTCSTHIATLIRALKGGG